MQTREQERQERRRCRSERVEAARRLVEGTKLSVRVIAARVGVSPATIRNLRARHGWSRPLPPRAPHRGFGFGNAIASEVVEAARVLIEGSTVSMQAIAGRLGVSTAALRKWRKARGWKRPPDAPIFLPGPRADGRARPPRFRSLPGQPYPAYVAAEAEALLRTTLMTQVAIAKKLAVSHAWVGSLLRQRGWERPPAPPGSKRFTRAGRTGPLATEGDRRGRPYAASVRREARILWEDTRLPTKTIARQVGAHPSTIAAWARKEAWTRPTGRPGPTQLRGWFGALKRQAGVSHGPAGGARPRVRML